MGYRMKISPDLYLSVLGFLLFCSVMEGEQGFPEEVPALMLYISATEVVGFNSIESSSYSNKLNPPRTCHHMGSELADSDDKFDESNSRSINHPRKHSVSMPVSPLADSFQDDNRHVLKDNNEMLVLNGSSAANQASSSQPNQVISEPMPKGCAFVEEDRFANITYHPNVKKLRDNRYNSFKTWSGKLERQLSHLHGRPRAPSPEPDVAMKLEREAVPVDRYFDALEWPELETLRSSEEILLPKDRTWPFLLRYPISSFGICLGVSSQAIMWKTLATSSSTKFLHISLHVNIVLWWISVALVVVTASAYILKLILYFEAVCREYYHPVRVNFFFAPWIALLFLALGVPPSVAQRLHTSLWYILMAPVLCLELKIYGQWMSGGQRRLSKVANPTNHLSVVGNFVGALLGASMGLKEGPLFFFAVGLAHYTVLFVTLYQRLPTNETLPKDLHPVFFLFVAAPSVGSMAWAKINGSFDYGARIAYFIALFLYFTLAVRVHFFRGFKFSLSWWAYTSPMTGAAIATIRYSNEVTTVVTQALAVILASASTLAVTALLVTTIVHAFVLGDLFPNDIAIAISDRKPKQHDKKWFHIRYGSSENKDIENYLKYANSDCTGIDASLDGSNKV